MKITEDCLTQVVSEASTQMDNPQYVTQRVDRLVGMQPYVAQYIIAHETELSMDGIVTVLFHLALIHESVVRTIGKSPSVISFRDLDLAAQEAPTVEALAETEPSLASYIASNFEIIPQQTSGEVSRRILTHVTKALVNC